MIQAFIYTIKKNKYSYFFTKLLLLFLIVCAVDFTCGGILHYFYFRQSSGWNYRTTYSMEKTKADLLIMGSSRASQQYHPEILEPRLHLSYYNCGRDGNFMLYNYAVLKAILKRYRPKMIILDFIKGQFNENPNEYDRLSILLPYYKDHPEIQSILELRSSMEKYKLISNIYPYNSTIFNTIIGNTNFNKERQKDIKGYVKFEDVWNQPLKKDNLPPGQYKLDSNFIHTYESFIKDCVNAKVKLYIVCSPYYSIPVTEDYSVTLGKNIAEKYNVSFIDYSMDTTLIRQPALFSDTIHVNNDGAKIFSTMVANEILGKEKGN